MIGDREPKVVILVTSFNDPPLLKDTLLSLLKTYYKNYEIIVVDSLSRKVKDLVEDVKRSSKVPIYYYYISKNLGISAQLNIGFKLAVALAKDAEYIARIEDDAILIDPLWLKKLVKIMEKYRDVQVIAPIFVNRNGKCAYMGGYLYGNGTVCSLDRYMNNYCENNKTYLCLCGGGPAYIVRKSYIVELFNAGIKPYCDFFFISSEDVDFALKVWLRGYKTALTTVTMVFHEGTTGPRRPQYRVYHMYKNRLCLLLMNFELRHILSNIWYRMLQDIVSALIHSEVALLFRAYMWVVKNLKLVLRCRRLRRLRWKRVNDREFKRYILCRIPMPIRNK